MTLRWRTIKGRPSPLSRPGARQTVMVRRFKTMLGVDAQVFRALNDNSEVTFGYCAKLSPRYGATRDTFENGFRTANGAAEALERELPRLRRRADAYHAALRRMAKERRRYEGGK